MLISPGEDQGKRVKSGVPPLAPSSRIGHCHGNVFAWEFAGNAHRRFERGRGGKLAHEEDRRGPAARPSNSIRDAKRGCPNGAVEAESLGRAGNGGSSESRPDPPNRQRYPQEGFDGIDLQRPSHREASDRQDVVVTGEPALCLGFSP
jgi:hypothetical protein